MEKRCREFDESLFFTLGAFISKHAGLVICVGCAFFAALSCGLLLAEMETDIDDLWIEKGDNFFVAFAPS